MIDFRGFFVSWQLMARGVEVCIAHYMCCKLAGGPFTPLLIGDEANKDAGVLQGPERSTEMPKS